jgi:hypothetical protein
MNSLLLIALALCILSVNAYETKSRFQARMALLLQHD